VADDGAQTSEHGLSGVPTRVVIITGDAIGPKLAGPGVRALEMARAMLPIAEVRVISFSTVEPVAAPFDVFSIPPGHDREFREHERWADVIVFQGTGFAQYPSLARSEKILVFDAYIPITLEMLELNRHREPDWIEPRVADATRWLDRQLLRADLVLVASERQRMFWLGQLAALGRVNSRTVRDDPALDGLIRVVPFGLSADRPQHTRAALKGVHPAIGPDDRVLLWGGGLYNWFDPFTLIRAVAEVATRHPEVKLYFLGTRSPTPEVPEMEIVRRSRELAAELGVAGTNVLFNESWVDFDDRQNYFLEADLGVSTHPPGIETTFSFRTRILDYLWADLPMVVTEGDHFGDLVERSQLGIAVPPGDTEALSVAIERMLFDEELRARSIANVREAAHAFEWHRALEPLIDFVRDPRRAADLPMRRPDYGRPRRMTRVDAARTLLRRKGLGAFARKVGEKLTGPLRGRPES
jgi:glycosyltransferase involved in cell wall biosynthesis